MDVVESAPPREDALRRAVLAMRQMRARLDVLEAERQAPIAVVGLGCRFPGGASDPDRYWDLLRRGDDAVGDVPADRWDRDAFFDPDPDAPGAMYTKRGGFITDPGRRFDAAFFGISPREAIATDPQHRLLLEVAWEALEHAGQSPDRLMGSRTGVFVGISTSDYGLLRYDNGGHEAIDPYWALGFSSSFAAGRLAYTFGFQGPVVPVDTACSSSLVAAHLAIQALRRGECDMALAGGVNLILSPSLTIYFCKLRALSPSGTCRTFDAAADGYVRGEGCGMVVLKRLADAEAAGDEVLAIIRGSAVNHGGRSGGITIPNGPAQQEVIRRALAESGLPPERIGYVEAHGTGTPLGDPIEMQALAATYGGEGRAEKLVVGSVKTQIGHLEAAAGIAGLARAVLALRHRAFPAHLHLDRLNPHIEGALAGRLAFRTPVAGEAWPDATHPRAAAVSSFGISGTNAHLVLEEAPPRPAASPLPGEQLLVLSAKTADALADLARAHANRLEQSDPPPLADLCHTAAAGRAHFAERLAVRADDPGTMADHLRAWLAAPAVAAPPTARGIGFHFGDRDGPLAEMTPDLAARYPVFATALDTVSAAPRLFARQYALASLWLDWGLRPQTVAGSGAGLALAAWACGALSLDDAIGFAQGASGLSWRRPRVAWISPSTGRAITSGAELDPAAPHADPAAWHEALRGAGIGFLIEIGGAPARPSNTPIALTLPADADVHRYVAATLAALYTAGIDPDWTAADRSLHRRKVTLPTYPFQRQEFWKVAAPAQQAAPLRPLVLRPEWQAAPAQGARTVPAIVLLVRDASHGEAASPAFATVANEIYVVPNGTALPAGDHPIIDLRFAGRPGDAADLGAAARAALPILQANPIAYWCATHGAFSIDAGNPADPAYAALWGLALSVRAERPTLELGMIDLDPADPAPPFARIAAEFAANAATGAPIAWRRGTRLQRGLIPADLVAEARPRLRADATHLVTGGLGGIGQQLIRWLVDRGARHILVPSRRGASDDRAAALADLTERGVSLTIAACDVTDPAALAALLDRIDASPQRLASVFHAAGISADALTENQDALTLDRVMAPKAAAAWTLHALTEHRSLDHFVLFASMAGVMGSAGQAPYAAANAALDALAHRRSVAGLPALSIDWGLWAGSGMVAALGERELERLARRGVRPMAPEAALALLGAAMTGSEPQLLIGDLAQPEPKSADATGAWRDRLDRAPEADRPGIVAECLRACLADALAIDPETIGEEADLFALGMDSLMVMNTIKRLKDALGCTLYPREFYQRPVLRDLAAYLAQEVAPGPAGAMRPTEAAPSAWASAPLDDRPLGPPVPGIGFILSTPRSGSTLLRVMLAGAAGLFAPPELHLLQFAGMASRAGELAASHLDEGLDRALMELDQGTAADARAQVDALVAADASVQDVYRLLHEKAGSRLLLDKSPSYAATLDTLRRADRLFDRPKFVHLVRHPVSMMDSFVRQRMDRLIGLDGADPLDIAEAIWRDMNRNILDLFAQTDADRQMTLRYEDLVADPEREGRRLCAFFGVVYDPALLDPYAAGRMTDGVGGASLSVGDPNFAARAAIDPALADSWRGVDLPRPLAAETLALAHRFGYEIPPTWTADHPAIAMREEVVQVDGLDLVLCRWGDRAAPAIVCLHGILEQGAAFGPLAAHLVGLGYQVVAPDLRGHGRSAHTPSCTTYQLADLAADLDAIVRHLECPPVVLVGASLGAAVAALFAASRPDAVRGLLLVEPPLQRPGDARRALSRAAPPAPAPLPDLPAAAARLTDLVPALDHDTARHLAERGTEQRADGRHWRWDPRLRAPGGIGILSDMADLLRTLAMPHALVFARDGDLLDARDWRAACNEHLTEITVLPGGHSLHLERPGELGRIVAALAGQP